MNNNSELIRVMSFNIRNDNGKDGENNWIYRKDRAASIIRFNRADVVGVQEALKNQVDDLAAILPEYNWVGVGRNDGKDGGEFAAIFYLKDRFELVESNNFWLSETPEVPGVKGWDAVCVRVATWAKFTDKYTGKSFFHFNTHFDHIGRIARVESSYLLLKSIDEIAKDEPCVVTGDFNATADSDLYKILTGKTIDKRKYIGKELKDAKEVSVHPHHGPSNTFNRDFRLGIGDGRIDFIFVKDNTKVYHHGTLADHWDGRCASDHMPIVADVKI